MLTVIIEKPLLLNNLVVMMSSAKEISQGLTSIADGKGKDKVVGIFTAGNLFRVAVTKAVQKWKKLKLEAVDKAARENERVTWDIAISTANIWLFKLHTI